ncbi:hypothetical protein [Staphylococcus carnosus]|uniref:Late competence protein ComGE n=1 Tax=Staphylococcus carnosus TaxID=1281 RepID=A0AAJ0JRP7_STACA|nr:hypothetical protein [Staphylococcus carnosus]KKB26191.1 hypothetical protein VV61_01520 [Staphylococcus carnosus]PNZ95288.1 hypothetical protein CD153_13490 [Staphylococcus carnosus]QQS85159.1 hypothetical protein I6J04_12605 [Staphylococcus carnosus]QRQ05092.1 hypothetical protein I6J34_12970 [Staphylococcus carnosus]UTB82913.1 hypothetical protein A2I67_06140 [Staphylococcus carnosus]
MKSKKINASFLLDALTLFGLILTLILLFLPFIINQHQQYQDELDIAEMNRILLISLNRFNYRELKEGVEITNFTVKYNNEKICAIEKRTKKSHCIQKQ